MLIPKTTFSVTLNRNLKTTKLANLCLSEPDLSTQSTAEPLGVMLIDEFASRLINSRLMNFIYEILNPEKGEALAQVKKTHVEQLPIPVVDLNDKTQRKIHDRLVELVDQMLTAQVNLRESESDNDLISIIDKQIDEAVYELYGLDPAEIRIVEEV